MTAPDMNAPIRKFAAALTAAAAMAGLTACAGAFDPRTDASSPVAPRVQARVDAVEVAPVTAETAAAIEDFARRTRERGRAPPPVDRR